MAINMQMLLSIGRHFCKKMVGLGFLNQNNAPTEKAKSALTYVDSITNIVKRLSGTGLISLDL